MKLKKISMIFAALALGFACAGAVACAGADDQDAAQPHDHIWSQTYSWDGTYHWQTCTVDGCTAINDRATHTYDAWQVTVPASPTEEGEETRRCSVCEYEQTQSIPATGGEEHTHVWADEWQSDASGHWHLCTVGGCSETSSVEPHVYGAWEEVKVPSETEEGLERRVCTVCKYEQTQSIPATGGGESISDTVTYAGAANESAAFEWKDSDASKAKVEYKLSSQSGYTALDGELIRQISASVARADVLGLRGGASYDFRITTSGGEAINIDNVAISAYDRSGYAHFNLSGDYSDGVGAYNNDGTLKDGAVVVYVTEETKNTVKAELGGKTYTGLVQILQNVSKSSVPVNIRIIGQISAATWNAIEYNSDTLSPDKVTGANGEKLPQRNLTEEEIVQGGYNTLNTKVYSKLNGLTNRVKYDSGKVEFDSYYNMCDISDARNVTVEGVGEDAKIFQWGFTWKKSSSIEVRNLTFDDYTEDACSFEGSENSSSIDGFNSQHIWVHHNTINEGKNYWDVCSEQDKHEGDGGTDFKYNSYVTLSYNHYYLCHKTGLVGGSDSQRTASITFHHNWYEDCGSRLPLGRQANMHMYNNYYDGSTGTNMSLRAGAYAFIENCYFDNANNPVTTQDGDGKIGVAKVYNCIFSGKNADTDKNNVTIVTSRTQKVENENIFAQDFDTNSSVFYYSGGKTDVTIMHSADEVPSVVPQLAGTLHRNNNILEGTVTVPGEGEGGEGEGETGGDEPQSGFTATVTVDGSSLVESNSAALGYEGGVNSSNPDDAAKYSVGSNRINLGGNAAYIKLTFSASAGQSVKIVVNASASVGSGIKIISENATASGETVYTVSKTAQDFTFDLTADGDGTVTVTIQRSQSSTVYVHAITVTVA